ncbi:MAG: GGDEF domain-containing protein, partial [Anaerolineaceae bacterium]|nr:GGDEF domain-containing protein [Anaerolineaceae bacterium]
RTKQPLSLVMLDIDRFKKLNDTYGHAAGDLVLQRLSGLLTSMTRAEDILARYGGEEFMIAMLNTPPEIAAARAEDWRIACQELTTVYEGQALHITISAGVAAFPLHTTEPGTLIRLTDAALYKAKDAGRNCVVIYEPGGSDGTIHAFPHA